MYIMYNKGNIIMTILNKKKLKKIILFIDEKVGHVSKFLS